MKITILQGAFKPVPPALGGAVEKRWYAMGHEFAEYGHEVVHISRAYGDLPADERVDGVLYKRVKGYNLPTSSLHLKWLDFCYSLRARSAVPTDSDIVVTNTFWAPLVLPSFLKKRCMVDVARMPKGQMRLYAQASRLRANSSPVAKAIMQELPFSQHQRVLTIPNPLPFRSLPAVDYETKKPVLLYAGRVHPEKGLELLIKAFKTLDTSWQLQIVGSSEIEAGGGGEPYLNSLKRLAGSSNVQFSKPVYDIERLNQYYAEASIFVYPSVSEYGETFGLAALEAMAWGCVPVVSNLACFQDFVVDKRNGLVFDHRSAQAVNFLAQDIDFLIKNKELRFSMAKEAIHVRQSHSTAYIAQLFLDEFEKMTEKFSETKNMMV